MFWIGLFLGLALYDRYLRVPEYARRALALLVLAGALLGLSAWVAAAADPDARWQTISWPVDLTVGLSLGFLATAATKLHRTRHSEQAEMLPVSAPFESASSGGSEE